MIGRRGKSNHRFRNAAAFGFLIAVLVCAVGLTVIYTMQTRMVFRRGGSVWRTPDDPAFGWPYEDITLNVGEHTTHGWYVLAENSRGTVLFCHANAGTIADRLDSIAVFRDLGMNVFIFDYGGYGNSTGRPSEERCYADARAAWRYLTEDRRERPDSLVIFGRSLGGGIAAELAAVTQPAGVILESTYVSIVQMGEEIVPIVPVKSLIRYRFANDKKVGRIRAPILIVHSPEDEVIPYHHGRTLFELAPEPKTFLEIHGDHYTGWSTSGETYIHGLDEFFDSVLPSSDISDR